jgi:hypothetical protein
LSKKIDQIKMAKDDNALRKDDAIKQVNLVVVFCVTAESTTSYKLAHNIVASGARPPMSRNWIA